MKNVDNGKIFMIGIFVLCILLLLTNIIGEIVFICMFAMGIVDTMTIVGCIFTSTNLIVLSTFLILATKELRNDT